MIALRMHISGIGHLDAALAHLLRTISDFTAIWPSVIDEFRKRAASQFDTEGGAGQLGKWKSLSPSYARRKEKKYPGAPIMVATGRLRASLVEGGAGSFVSQSPTILAIGTSVPYARYHQKGTGYLPVRRLIDPSRMERLAYARVIHRAANRTALRGFSGARAA